AREERVTAIEASQEAAEPRLFAESFLGSARRPSQRGCAHRALFSWSEPISTWEAKRSSGNVSLLNFTVTLPDSLALASTSAVLLSRSSEYALETDVSTFVGSSENQPPESVVVELVVSSDTLAKVSRWAAS